MDAKTDFTYRIYSGLCPEARFIRESVFVQEQGFREEFDERDAASSHIVLYCGGKAVGTCRCFAEDGVWRVGRVAVLREARGKSAGAQLMRAAENFIRAEGGKTVLLSAQVRAKGFYERCGYRAEGNTYEDESVPHVRMRKKL